MISSPTSRRRWTRRATSAGVSARPFSTARIEVVLLARAAGPAVLQRHLESACGDELREVAPSGRGSDADRFRNVVGEETGAGLGEERENAFLRRRSLLGAVAAGDAEPNGRERVVYPPLVDISLG